jgi:uncharacterized protein (DUF952 family)
MSAAMRILYKILKASEWRAAEAEGMFRGSAVDHKDGFIHLSAGYQVRETAARHFAGQEDLVLVGFEEAKLDKLKWEPSRGGDLFPHVYGGIQTAKASFAEPLPLVDGLHQFPEGTAP